MEITRRNVPDLAAALGTAGIAPVMARVFAARGIASIAELDNDLAGLPPWQALKGIAAAVERLADAIERGERLLIVADYDADGATACAVGMRGLAAMGATVEFLVPNRFEFGYGLTPEIVALAAARQPNVIITVDNGIASVEGVAAARAFGIDVLITDHHLPGGELPETAWIVNPNQPGCTFPSKHLAGVGVMFYVLCALRAVLRERGHFAQRAEPHLAALLDLVAKRAPGTISRFGGHAYAAGLTLHETALPRFIDEFERVGREWLSPALLKRTIETDGALEVGELTLGLAQSCAAHVWGPGFPAPAFDAEFAVTEQRIVGDKHMKLALALGERRYEAIVFRQTAPLPPRIRAAYRPEVNHYQGLDSLQLVIEHWLPA